MKSTDDTTGQSTREPHDDPHELVVGAEKMAGNSVSKPTSGGMGAKPVRFGAVCIPVGRMYTRKWKQIVAGALRAEEAVRKTPSPALLLATGAGVIAGVLLGWRVTTRWKQHAHIGEAF